MRDDEIGLDLDAVVGMDEVGQRVGIADDELNVEKPGRAGTPPRFVDQIGIAVDADDAPGERRKSQGNASGPGADVDDRFSRERLVDEQAPERFTDAGRWRRISATALRSYPVVAPSDADDTSRAYFAMTPVA